MSQRTNKVASLVQQIVAAELAQVPNSARLTVTGVQASPDLRNATIWISVIAHDEAAAQHLFKTVALPAREQLQEAVARRLTTKFVPRLTVQRDTGGEYADQINRLIKGL